MVEKLDLELALEFAIVLFRRGKVPSRPEASHLWRQEATRGSELQMVDTDIGGLIGVPKLCNTCAPQGT